MKNNKGQAGEERDVERNVFLGMVKGEKGKKKLYIWDSNAERNIENHKKAGLTCHNGLLDGISEGRGDNGWKRIEGNVVYYGGYGNTGQGISFKLALLELLKIVAGSEVGYGRVSGIQICKTKREKRTEQTKSLNKKKISTCSGPVAIVDYSSLNLHESANWPRPVMNRSQWRLGRKTPGQYILNIYTPSILV